jgi:hypothetical protein
LSLNLLTRLANNNECTIALRREFLQFHSNFRIAKKINLDEFPVANHRELLNKLYSLSNGIILGEEHFDNLSVSFIIENIKHLSELGVKTLFFEGLQFGLERGLDGNRDEKDSAYEEYGELLDVARLHNIKLVGIDAPACKKGEGLTRDIFMNIYAQSIINNMPDKGKWLALVGMMHLGDSVYINPLSFERHAVRGLSQLTSSVGIILDSVAPGNEYIKFNDEFAVSPAKSLSADLIIGTHNKKTTADKRRINLTIHHFDEVYEDFSELGIAINYYDIDNFARLQNNQYQKGVVFSLVFDKLPPRPA